MHKVYILILFTPLLQAMHPAQTQQAVMLEADSLLQSIQTLKEATDRLLHSDMTNHFTNYNAFVAAKNDCSTRYNALFDKQRNTSVLSQEKKTKLSGQYGQVMKLITRNNLN